MATQKEKWLSKPLIYIALIVGALFTVAPFIWLVRSSVMTIQEIFSMPPKWLPAVPQWHNYVDVFTTLPFGQFFINTTVIVILNVIGALLSNTIMAYAFARIPFRGRSIMYGLCLATLMLPATVTMIPLFIKWKYLGGLNTFAPLFVPAFFGNAFYIFMLHQFFKTIPIEFDEAAFVDGASYPQIIAKIIVPVAKPALAVVAIFSFLNSWNDFMGPLLYLNDQAKFTLSLGLKMFLSMFRAEWNTLMAAATLAVLPLVAIFFMAQRYFIEGLTMGGIKG
ncbi:MAG TPA: sugar ABC transporter ATP-binding protein [Firmicutes bacterium]|jgi:multiple sugar transport system permease protein|nr:sugar ABC transporter ATP-binding protein [Bacillota bacterium]